MGKVALSSRQLEQCRFEIELASRLRGSSKIERQELYSRCYDEYAKQFPEALSNTEHKHQSIGYELAFIRRFVKPDSIVVEIGPGRCLLAFALAPYVQKIYGIDVSSPLTDADVVPDNFKLLLCDGLHLPLDDQSVDVVMSNELVEHLHPDDVVDQMTEALRILKPGGKYLCGTPNRIAGPHDCSNLAPELPCIVIDDMYVANGLHLKEYTNSTLADLFYRTGFTKVTPYSGARGSYAPVPLAMMRSVEAMAKRIPVQNRSRSRTLRALIGVRMVAVK